MLNVSDGQNISNQPLFVFNGTVFDIPVRILKDDGASTILMSRRFCNLNRGLSPISQEKVSVSHFYSTENDE